MKGNFNHFASGERISAVFNYNQSRVCSKIVRIDCDGKQAMSKLLRRISIIIICLAGFSMNLAPYAKAASQTPQAKTSTLLFKAWEKRLPINNIGVIYLTYDPVRQTTEPGIPIPEDYSILSSRWSPNNQYLLADTSINGESKYCLFTRLMKLERCLEGTVPDGEYEAGKHWALDNKSVQYLIHPSELVYQIVEANIADGKITRTLFNFEPTQDENDQSYFSFVWNSTSSKITVIKPFHKEVLRIGWIAKTTDTKTKSTSSMTFEEFQQFIQKQGDNKEVELCDTPSPKGTYIAAVVNNGSKDAATLPAILLFDSGFQLVARIAPTENSSPSLIVCPFWDSAETRMYFNHWLLTPSGDLPPSRSEIALYEYDPANKSTRVFATYPRIGFGRHDYIVSPDLEYIATTLQIYDENLVMSLGVHVLKRGGEFVRIDAPYKWSGSPLWIPAE